MNHPLIESITKEIVAESADLFPTSTSNTNDIDLKEHNFVSPMTVH